jgi:putative tricarboxylic transport membrane protein
LDEEVALSRETTENIIVRGTVVIRRLYQTAALFFIFLGIFIVWESRILKYYTSLGPGAGFLPFWVGVALTILSCVWLAQVSFEPAKNLSEGFLPNRKGGKQVLSILSALVLCVVLLGPLGFSLTMFGFLIFLLLILGRQKPVVTLVIALIGSFGVQYVFENWLGVGLPKSSIGILKGLGL